MTDEPYSHESPIDDVMEARKKAMQAAYKAASHGDPLAGQLAALEHLAEPFFLGLDEDPDDSDMDVWP